MTNWEYTFISVDKKGWYFSEDGTRLLHINNFGLAGWELVSINWEKDDFAVAVFKRPHSQN